MYDNDERWLSHKYYVSYMIMQRNMTMTMCVIKTERWKLHGNISWSGYGNAIICRYGGCFEDDIRRLHWYSEVLYTRFLTPFRDGILNRRQVSDCDRGSFLHDPETVGIGPPATHAQQNEVVCDRRAIKYGYTGPIGSNRKYIPHSQSQTNISVCYVHSTQSI
jgi:hypothetical protein